MSTVGLAVVPETGFVQQLVDFQRDCPDLPARPPLGLERNLPHVSILQLPVRPFDHEEALSEIASGLGGAATRALVPTGVSYKAVGWVFLDVERSPWLMELQEIALEATARFVDPSQIDPDKDLSGYSEEERANYRRYGYRYVGSAFRPHVTLGTVDAVPSEALVRRWHERFAGEVGLSHRKAERLAFYRAGEYGSFAESLAETALG